MGIKAGFARLLGIVLMVGGLMLGGVVTTVLADDNVPADPATTPADQVVDQPTTTVAADPPADPPADAPADTPADPPVDTPSGDASHVQSLSAPSGDVGALAPPVGTTSVTWTGNGVAGNGQTCNTTSSDLLNPGPNQKGWLFVLNQISGTPADWRLAVTFSGGSQTGLVPVQTPGNGVAKWAVYSGLNDTLLSAVATNGGTGGTSTGNLVVSHCFSGAQPGTFDISVTKTQSGYSDGDQFTVAVDCDNNAFDDTFTFTVVLGQAVPSPQVVQHIPDGVTCSVTETGTGNPNPVDCVVTTTVNGTEGTQVTGIQANATAAFANTLACESPRADVSSEVRIDDGTDVTGSTLQLGTTVHDVAFVQGDAQHGTPDGTVDFQRFETNGSCTGTPDATESGVALTDTGSGELATADSADFTPAAAGPFSYLVHYNGGVQTAYLQGDGVCEPFSVIEARGGDTTTVSLSVQKVITGETPPPTGTVYKAHVVCTGDATADVVVTFTYPTLAAQPIALSGGGVIPLDGSVKCSVTETQGGTLKGYQVNGGSLQNAVTDLELNSTTKVWLVTIVNDPTTVEGTVVTSSSGASGTSLPFTGGGPGWTLPTGILLVLGGATLVIFGRRRRTLQLDDA